MATGGLVLTNHHVIEAVKKVAVQLPDRKEPVAAKVIADDSRRDLALPSEVVQGFLAEHLPKGARLTPPVRGRNALEWDEIDAQVKASVLLIVQTQ